VSAPILLLILLLNSQDPRDCADAASCRTAALEAAARSDYETFHDLAWRAVQKGRRNDPELMNLLARAQSLSGRPGDALVMLRRLAQMGVATEAETSDDFRRVRALPAWPELEALIKNAEAPAPPTPAPEAAAPVPAPASRDAAPVTKPAAAPIEAPAPIVRKPSSAAVPLETGSGETFEDEPLPTSLAAVQPAGLVYDSVSRRFIIGNRAENNLIIYDNVFKRATGMVSAESAGFFALSAMEIDSHRGDLWVVNSSADRASVHKLQLVSGRVLFDVPLQEELGPAALVDAAIRDDGRVLLLDAVGRRILGVSPGRHDVERIMSIDAEAPTSLAVANGQIVFVAHRKGLLRVDVAGRNAAAVRNAPAALARIRPVANGLVAVQTGDDGVRLIRLRLDSSKTRVVRVEVLDATGSMPDPAGLTVANGFVYYLTTTGGASAIRRVRATK
jgi:hypothetical protein